MTGTALIVMDLQNDFCIGPAVASRYPGRQSLVDMAAAGTARAVDVARTLGVEVIFVRFHGDIEYQGPSWRHRDLDLGKRPKCRAGTWGAEFHRVSPLPDERVFTKQARFDAFLTEGFGEHLIRGGTGHLVFAGLYTDVCVDSTARTAFQQGFHVSVLTDCTTSLHLPDDTTLRFMHTVYGARLRTLDDPETWSLPGRREDWPTRSRTVAP